MRNSTALKTVACASAVSETPSRRSDWLDHLDMECPTAFLARPTQGDPADAPHVFLGPLVQ